MKLNCWTKIAEKFDISPFDAEKKFKNLRTAYFSKEKENDPMRFRGNNCSHFEGIFESVSHQVALSSEMSFELKTFVADFPCPFFVFLGE